MLSPPPNFPFELPSSLPEEGFPWLRSLVAHLDQLAAENIELKEQVLQQAETIQELRDEIAVLKGQKGRPVMKPSRMDQETDKDDQTGERDERLLLLAGRSWRVTDVDWSKRIVWLEPAAGGGKALWMGGARSLGREVCQGIRSVLANGASPAITLSRRARTALETLAEEIPMSSGTHFVMSRVDGAPVQTWTFAGTRANRTLARQASTGGAKVRFAALSVQAPVAALAATLPERIDLTGDELAAFHESIKFADCVPRQLISGTIVARNFEVRSGPSGSAV